MSENGFERIQGLIIFSPDKIFKILNQKYKEFFDKSMNGLQDGMKPIILALVERLRMTTHLLTRIGLELESTKNKINSYTLKQQD
ncbi:MAG TPA: hypothetical protein EYQ03_02645 [Nitrospinaceae bacterium]|nr:hypothetical protein [Nitrospinaceae bacterium]